MPIHIYSASTILRGSEELKRRFHYIAYDVDDVNNKQYIDLLYRMLYNFNDTQYVKQVKSEVWPPEQDQELVKLWAEAHKLTLEYPGIINNMISYRVTGDEKKQKVMAEQTIIEFQKKVDDLYDRTWRYCARYEQGYGLK